MPLSSTVSHIRDEIRCDQQTQPCKDILRLSTTLHRCVMHVGVINRTPSHENCRSEGVSLQDSFSVHCPPDSHRCIRQFVDENQMPAVCPELFAFVYSLSCQKPIARTRTKKVPPRGQYGSTSGCDKDAFQIHKLQLNFGVNNFKTASNHKCRTTF